MDKQIIEAEARAAAAMGHTAADACPYPFDSPEGMHWMACYLLAGSVKRSDHWQGAT